LGVCAGAAAEGAGAPGLLFRASFDRLTAFADSAKGALESTLETSLEFRSKPGVVGSCLVLEDGERCAYHVKGNLDTAAATVSFWVKPVNWSDKKPRYEKFFRVSNADYGIHVGKPGEAGLARAWIRVGRWGTPLMKTFFAVGRTKWDGDTWHKIDVTWDSTHVAIYIDGRLGSRTDLPNISLPALDDCWFELVPLWTQKTLTHHADDRTFIDEVEIRRGVLSRDRILKNYIAQYAALAGDMQPPVARVPRCAGIALDGRLDDAAWAKAARVSILSDIRTGFPHSSDAAASVCWDAENLYVGLWSERPGGAAPLANQTARDGKLWEDDSFEIFIIPGDDPGKPYCQFLLNAKGALYDGRGGDQGWTSNARVAAAVGDEAWTAEFAVPFADLASAAPAPGDVWLVNFCRDWPQPPPAKPIWTSWAHSGYAQRPEAFGRLVFDGGAEGARITLGPGLPRGRLEVAGAFGRPGKLQCVVTADKQTVFEQAAGLPGEKTIQGVLRDVKTGVLAATVTDAEGASIAEYRTRFMVQEPVSVTLIPDVLGGKLDFQIDLQNLDPEWAAPVKAGKASLEVLVEGPEGIRAEQSLDLSGLNAALSLPLQFRDGDYRIAYTLRAPGMAEPFVAAGAFSKPPTPWLGAQAGVTDEVLTPWTPLTYESGAAVGCWNREYAFNGPLLASVKSAGREMLRGPVRLALETVAGRGDLAQTSRTATRQDPARAEFAGEARFGALDVGVKWSSWMEYDGLTVGRVTIEPPAGGVEVRRLALFIPLRSDVVKYIRGERLHPNRTDWDGAQWESGFEPTLWVHNETEGFCYFFEHEGNWVYPEGAKVTRVRGGAEAGIELSVISSPVRVAQPLSYEFGFQGTPGRPMVASWRDWDFGLGVPLEGQNAYAAMNNFSSRSGLLDVACPPMITAWDARRDKLGIRDFYYSTTSCTANDNPIFDLFGRRWHCSFAAQFGPYVYKKTPFRPPVDTYYLLPICNGAPTFTDYLTWQGRELLELVGPEGIYTDCDKVTACDNAGHGHGFTDAFGRKGVSYPILDHRALLKRLAGVVRGRREGGERAYYMTHCHSRLVPPVHGWADFFFPGEQYTHRIYGNRWYYIDDLDESAWRCELASAPSGVVHVFLAEFVRGSKDKTDYDHPEYTESLLAMASVNDALCSAAYCNRKTIEQYWALRKRLAFTNAEFIGHWRPDCPVKAETERALAAAYVMPGRALVPVVNRLPETATVSVKADLAALGLAGQAVKVVDERTGESLTIEGGAFSVGIKGRNFTYVSLAGE